MRRRMTCKVEAEKANLGFELHLAAQFKISVASGSVRYPVLKGHVFKCSPVLATDQFPCVGIICPG